MVTSNHKARRTTSQKTFQVLLKGWLVQAAIAESKVSGLLVKAFSFEQFTSCIGTPAKASDATTGATLRRHYIAIHISVTHFHKSQRSHQTAQAIFACLFY